MALALKDLGTGQLPSSKGTLYTCGVTGALAKVRLVNTGAAVTLNLYVNKSGTSRLITPKDLPLAASEAYSSIPVTLENGDLIEGDASAATRVDYTINGVEDS